VPWKHKNVLHRYLGHGPRRYYPPQPCLGNCDNAEPMVARRVPLPAPTRSRRFCPRRAPVRFGDAARQPVELTASPRASGSASREQPGCPAFDCSSLRKCPEVRPLCPNNNATERGLLGWQKKMYVKNRQHPNHSHPSPAVPSAAYVIRVLYAPKTLADAPFVKRRELGATKKEKKAPKKIPSTDGRPAYVCAEKSSRSRPIAKPSVQHPKLAKRARSTLRRKRLPLERQKLSVESPPLPS